MNIGGVDFKTQQKARAHCKAMLGRGVDGQTINEQDSEFLRDLLKRHPHAREKSKCGVKRFFKNPGPAPNYGTSCFWIERTDGSVEHFSYICCVTGREK